MKKEFSQTVTASITTLSELSPQEQMLINKAIQVRKNAQAPYSNFFVGCAVLDQNGIIHVGCNVERCSYSQTTHAEQNAIDSMIAQCGPKKIALIAIAAAAKDTIFTTDNNASMIESSLSDAKTPCGHCLQIIWENCLNDPSVKILSIINNGEIFVSTISDLLPIRFGPEQLGINYAYHNQSSTDICNNL